MIAAMWLASLGQASVSAPSLEGRYWMTITVRSRMRVPVLGWIPSTTVSRVLAELRPKPEGGWEQHHQVCEIEIESGDRKAQTTIPQAFVSALPVKVYDVSLSSTGETSEGLEYRADLGTDYVGYDPTETATDELPKRPGDAGVVDPDGDGNPGMTVQLHVPLFGTGELYIVQRGAMALSGVVSDGRTIEGDVEVGAIEQHTLKATNPLFSGSPPIEPLPGESRFRLERTTGSSCDEAARLAEG